MGLRWWEQYDNFVRGKEITDDMSEGGPQLNGPIPVKKYRLFVTKERVSCSLAILEIKRIE